MNCAKVVVLAPSWACEVHIVRILHIVVDAGLTEDCVTLGTFQRVQGRNKSVAQAAQEVAVQNICFEELLRLEVED